MLLCYGLSRPLLGLGAALLSSSLALATQGNGYPPPLRKDIQFAQHDLRGKQGPDLSSVRWLGNRPTTQGKVVVIHYLLPWCNNCRDLAQTLNKWQAEFSKDVTVVGVTVEAESAARDFMRQARPRYTVGIDPSRRSLDSFGVRGYPFVAVISPDGVVRWQGWPNDSVDPLDARVLRQIVAAAKAAR
jgi:thiol-disulfide isomerase/thioredoxin